MKKFLTNFFLPLFVLITFSLFFYKFIILDKNSFFYWSFCDKPVYYKVGNVDERFNIQKSEFLEKIQQAETIWENTNIKNLFTHDPNSDLSINLVFDQRQSLNDQINSLANDLKTGKSSLDPQIERYKSLLSDFNKNISDLNEEINYWNSQGGAPSEKYEELKKRQQQLKDSANQLNQMAQTLNQSTQAYNIQVGTLQKTVNTFNTVLKNKPEEGLYSPKENKIDIYFNINDNELVHTLAHEMGHALNLDHNQNDKSIMYPFTTDVIVPSQNDIEDLAEACQKYTIVDLFTKRLSLGFENLIINLHNL